MNSFRLLRPDEIEIRVGQVSKDNARTPWYSLLLYKDARCDMSILDETVGPSNWTRTHKELKGVIYCTVSIRFPIYEDVVVPETDIDGAVNLDPNTGKPILKTVNKFVGYTDWASKEDCGTESNTEKEKGEASDSFKRACVNWGLGRELYTAPRIFISEPWASVGDRRALYVSDINYDEDGNITDVTIRDHKDETFAKKFRNR